ncbi:hypothetical protein FB45DRAFT_1150309 [Roridomyces roridus]|uniref:Fork-head domain-containing protein n=1 Tax=Roridomyces roridus TaxID=1738132 RepID=A0AAD7BTI1_9AGAR|nr:hypothetical protein FB45DRAFT_1150309 [Roridomyces roridus]
MGTQDNDLHLRQWVHLDQDFICSGPLTPDSTISPASTPGPQTPDSSVSRLLTPRFSFMDAGMQGGSVPLCPSYHTAVAASGYDGPLLGYDHAMSSFNRHDIYYQYNNYPSTSLLMSSSNPMPPSPQFDLNSPEYLSDEEEGLQDLDDMSQIAAAPNYKLAIPLNTYRPIDAGNHLCDHLNIPRGSTVNLESLAENARGQPVCKLYIAVAVAIYSSPHKVLTLGGIRDALVERFPGLSTYEAWQSSIRHALSFQASFVKIIRPPTFGGRGFLWGLDVSRGGLKRTRKRKSAQERAEAARQAAESKTSSARCGKKRTSKKGKAKSNAEPSGGRRKKVVVSLAPSSSDAPTTQRRCSPRKARA